MYAKTAVFCCVLLSIPAFAQQTDAERAALLAVQQRNAGVVNNLVDQTPSYQQGYAIRLEAVKQREAAQRNAARHSTRTTQRMSTEDQAALDNLNSDLNRVESSGGTRASRDAQARAIRDQQRQVYDRAGMVSPIAAEVAPQPDRRQEMRGVVKDVIRDCVAFKNCNY